ncbi:MAG: RdgB/HAM1 family non-canonical purine NTP pyrophosphatase [Gemmatimonadetes bacterium]|nr:RdgB/HAM1 family non-canonical purine NTP pyrophosphatase [Gemmatimonadota bacterium]
MNDRPLLLATRSADKLREIRQILADHPSLRVIGLDEAGVEETPEEEGIECFETFEENSLAKARYYAARSGLPTLADDSGLCVDALDGAPGVYSKRFAGRPDLKGGGLDRANNALLLEKLSGVPEAERTARYVCVVALALGDGEEHTFRGTCEGVILLTERGVGGFGYDPLFYIPEEDATFGELPPERKNALSHRGRAIRAAGNWMARGLDESGYGL